MKLSFADTLLAWFARSARPLPWREAAGQGHRRDPYAVMVSELMLQQTQVTAVIPYYERFMARFPDIETLAVADETEVLKYWEGLGYYRRAKNLLALAGRVVDQYEGVLPRNKADLLNLPGIGPYTAGAILSFAYDLAEPAVDGNVVRVMARLDAVPHVQGDPKGQRAVRARVAELFPRRRAGDFSEALMELGATVCLPSTPFCSSCPVNGFCRAFSLSTVTRYPIRRRGQDRPVTSLTYVLIHDGEQVLCRRRPQGLLSGLFEFFCFEGKITGEGRVRVREEVQAKTGLTDFELTCVGERRAVFSHRVWEMAFWEAELAGQAGYTLCDAPSSAEDALDRICISELAGLPFPAFLLAWRDDFVRRREK
ncbi:MAG: A/G-specific adenine glycosylase [Clostridiaceae bacterium]|nr:A/G-specific adenine glycosylase [Clostridiaceae bacterium]